MQQFVEKIVNKTKVAIIFSIILSLAINLLMLTVPLYMLQLFDRVIASQSSDTLIFLTIIAIVALIVMSLLDTVRSRISARIANWLDHELNPNALQQSISHYLWGDHYSKRSLSDIMQIRAFVASPAFFIVFDAPWIVIYLLVIYLLSVPLGVIATIGAVLLILLAFLNERLIRTKLKKDQQEQAASQQLIESTFRNAEIIRGMGMTDDISKNLQQITNNAGTHRLNVSDRSTSIANSAKFIRLALQILMLGTGAYLVITGNLTAGSMIAGSIILGRALAPIEQSIGGWKTMVTAWQAFKRLRHFFDHEQPSHEALEIKKLTGVLQVERLSFAIQKNGPRLVQDISFSLQPGHGFAIIGPTGAGKSTLARLILGIWPPSLGTIRLDNIETYQLNQTMVSLNFGYCPQTPSYFDSSIKHNIARCGKIEEQAIIEAAKLVNIHEHILKLPHGYDTSMIGFNLSAGFKQRIALARAFYNKPSLVVLDEPENFLDNDGLISLEQAIERSKQQGCSIILITHRPSLAMHCQHTMVLNQGKCQRIGSSKDMLPTRGGQHE